MSGNYEYRRIPDEGGLFTRHELQHLLKPHFWILAVLVLYLYIFDKTNSEATLQGTKSHLGPHERPQPRPRSKHIVAMVMSLGIPGLVWTEEYMVLSTWWRVAPKILFTWRPSLTPLRLQLLVLYPAWAMVSALCIAAVALVVTASVHITKVQLGWIEERKAKETEAAKAQTPADEKI
ncbi:hypothetical protein CIB48_g10199 [Xylaria polymorpha]|nr:hypothetical protein CIB48_g10199 [Xylaria polymorpha]